MVAVWPEPDRDNTSPLEQGSDIRVVLRPVVVSDKINVQVLVE
jgi:hypothetical protein